MIEKWYASYDNNIYYTDYNKKKLAQDNLKVVGGMLTFFLVVGMAFIGLAIAFGNGLTPYAKYLPAMGVLLVMFGIHSLFTRKKTHDFKVVRVYSLIMYTIVLLSFSIADANVYQESRAVFFPVAVILFSALYIDYFWIVTIYKVLMAVIFLTADLFIKSRQVVIYDAVVALLAILGSCFAFDAIVNTALARHEDSEVLVQKSQTDLLTGLLNKVSFEERCRDYLEKRVIGASCTLFIFDLDDFKYVNDNFGHQTGDKTLKLFSEILRGYFHPDDIIGRVGGDEFMILVLGDMPDGFSERRCRSVIHELKTTDIDGAKGITCSIGIVEDTQGHGFQELYNKADQALYKSKQGGKAKFTIETF